MLELEEKQRRAILLGFRHTAEMNFLTGSEVVDASETSIVELQALPLLPADRALAELAIDAVDRESPPHGMSTRVAIEVTAVVMAQTMAKAEDFARHHRLDHDAFREVVSTLIKARAVELLRRKCGPRMVAPADEEIEKEIDSALREYNARALAAEAGEYLTRADLPEEPSLAMFLVEGSIADVEQVAARNKRRRRSP